MAMRAGFAEADITPPLGTAKIGWLKELRGERVADPLFARVAVFECGGGRIGFAQLDTLSVRWTQTRDIRARVEKAFGFPGANLMVAATHNHAGPAVAGAGDVKRDEAYVEAMTAKIVEAFGRALEGMAEAEVGMGSAYEFGLSHNRRVVMRDGIVKTHGKVAETPGLPLKRTASGPVPPLFVEGPIDPEVAALWARRPGGEPLGAIVNFTCHPTHLGGGTDFSAGYPGAVAAELKRRGAPVALFLNGASGNISAGAPYLRAPTPTMEQMGQALADHAMRLLGTVSWQSEARLWAAARTIALPYRDPAPDQTAGTAKGAQRFIDPAIYDRNMPALVERVKTRGAQPAEVQVLGLDDVCYAAIPAEYFVEHGLRIKLETWPRHALIVGHANGMVGYVPTRAAFERGGYETTFNATSRMAPEAGDLLADAAIELIRSEGGE